MLIEHGCDVSNDVMLAADVTLEKETSNTTELVKSDFKRAIFRSKHSTWLLLGVRRKVCADFPRGWCERDRQKVDGRGNLGKG